MKLSKATAIGAGGARDSRARNSFLLSFPFASLRFLSYQASLLFLLLNIHERRHFNDDQRLHVKKGTTTVM